MQITNKSTAKACNWPHPSKHVTCSNFLNSPYSPVEYRFFFFPLPVSQKQKPKPREVSKFPALSPAKSHALVAAVLPLPLPPSQGGASKSLPSRIQPCYLYYIHSSSLSFQLAIQFLICNLTITLTLQDPIKRK